MKTFRNLVIFFLNIFFKDLYTNNFELMTSRLFGLIYNFRFSVKTCQLTNNLILEHEFYLFRISKLINEQLKKERERKRKEITKWPLDQEQRFQTNLDAVRNS